MQHTVHVKHVQGKNFMCMNNNYYPVRVCAPTYTIHWKGLGTRLGYAFGRVGLCIIMWPKNWLFEVLLLENLSLVQSTARSSSLTAKKGQLTTPGDSSKERTKFGSILLMGRERVPGNCITVGSRHVYMPGGNTGMQHCIPAIPNTYGNCLDANMHAIATAVRRPTISLQIYTVCTVQIVYICSDYY